MSIFRDLRSIICDVDIQLFLNVYKQHIYNVSFTVSGISVTQTSRVATKSYSKDTDLNGVLQNNFSRKGGINEC
jgi:hypothetical protein